MSHHCPVKETAPAALLLESSPASTLSSQPCLHLTVSTHLGCCALSQYHTGTLYATQLSSLVLFALGQRGFLRDKDIFVMLGEPL